MERNVTAAPSNEFQAPRSESESVPSKNRRRRRRRGGEHRSEHHQPQAMQERGEIVTHTIWNRLAPNELVSIEESEAVQVTPSSSEEDARTEPWVDEFAEAPVGEVVNSPYTFPDDEPYRNAEAQSEYRKHFWDELEVRQSTQGQVERDILPYPSTEQSPDTTESSAPSATAKNEKSSFRFLSGAAFGYILGRQRGKGAIQSPVMKNSPEFSINAQGTAAQELGQSYNIEFPQAEIAQAYNEVPLVPELPVPRSQATVPEQLPNVAPAAEQHSMRQADLLTIAESIVINGVTVHEMFGARRIDEAGLRRIVHEYLRGGDVKQLINQEVLRQQARFERDPQVRTQPLQSAQSHQSATHHETSPRHPPRPHNQQRAERVMEAVQERIGELQEFVQGRISASTVITTAAIVIIYSAIVVALLI